MKFYKYNKGFIISALIVSTIYSCVEPVDIETQAFQSSLVLEAHITDELKHQEITLTGTYSLEEDDPRPISDAYVFIMEGNQNVYDFEEVSPGKYISVSPFKAHPGLDYQLRIITDGMEYISDPVQLAESTGIDDLYVRLANDDGEEGIAIQVNNFNQADASSFYRYDYEETYKIISRYSYPYDLVFIDNALVEVPKTKEETICFNTKFSGSIILGNTSAQSDNNLEGFLVKFINRQNPIISQRYSILVKQYAITREAHSYYSTVKKMAGSENVFSQNQPGFVEGNVYSPENPDAKVIGFFNVSSYSSKRIYFNYTDFFEETTRPYFTENCNPENPLISGVQIENLIALLEAGYVKYLGEIPPEGVGGPYRIVEAPCVDCTLLGSSTNVVPDFWEE